MFHKAAVFGLLALALVSFTGCERECCCEDNPAPQPTAPVPTTGTTAPKESPPKTAATNVPQVSGKWEGRWESSHPGHGGGLKCEAKESGPQKWEAVFTAEFGQIKAYNVKLEGKPGDGKVLFGGSIDLGQKDGGVFTWTGDANATEFNGKYSGGGDTGTFKMKRAK